MSIIAAAPVGGQRQELNISGSQILTYQTTSVSGGAGAESSYQLDNYGSDKALQSQTSLTVNGTLVGNLSIDARYNSSAYGLTDSRWALRYDAGSTDFELGDLMISFPGSDLTSFSRSLQGLKVDTTLGQQAGIGLVVSRSKAASTTDVLRGNNTVGPYYLTHSPIIDGSEEVRVDEQIKVSGRDYFIDYTFGAITFRIGYIIPSTSTIAVSYEYLPAGGAGGTFTGVHGSWAIAKNLCIASTFLKQAAAQDAKPATPVREREEFYGQNSPGPYALTFRPIRENSEQVTVGSVLQIPALDYVMNYISGTITFIRPVSPASLIVVEYDFLPGRGATLADHTVWGMSGVWLPSKDWNIMLELAQSKGGSRPTDSGSAFSLRAAGQIGDRLRLTTGIRNLADGFQRMESSGFARDQSGFDATLDYNFGKFLSLQTIYTNFSSPQRLYFGTATSTSSGESDTSQLNASLVFRKPGLPQLQLTHRRLSSDSVSSTDTTTEAQRSQNDYMSDNLDLHYAKGPITLTGNLNQTRQTNSMNLTDTVSSLLTDSLTRSNRLGIVYTPGKSLRINADIASTTVNNEDAEDSKASNKSVGISYTPNSRLSISLLRYQTHSEGTGATTTYGGSYIGNIGYGYFAPWGAGGAGSTFGTGYNWGSSAGSGAWGITPGTTGFVNNGIGLAGYSYGTGGYDYGTGGGRFGGSPGAGPVWGTTRSGSPRTPSRGMTRFSTTVSTPGVTTSPTPEGLTNTVCEEGLTTQSETGLTNKTQRSFVRAGSQTPLLMETLKGAPSGKNISEIATEWNGTVSAPNGLTTTAAPGLTTPPVPSESNPPNSSVGRGLSSRDRMSPPVTYPLAIGMHAALPWWQQTDWSPARWGRHSVISLGPSRYVPAVSRSLVVRQTTPTETSVVDARTTSLRMDYVFSSKLSANIGFNRQLNLGSGSVTNSDSKDTTIGGTYRFSDSLSFFAQYAEQWLTFLDSSDNSHSKITMFGVQLGRPDKVNLNVDFQRLLTFTNEGSSYVGGVGGFMEQQLDSWSARLNYPLSQKYALFTEFFQATTAGNDADANSQRRDLAFGLDYNINRYFTLTTRWTKQRSLYATNKEQNYNASNFTAELRAAF